MKRQVCLILFGVLIAHAALSIPENTEDNSPSDESSSYRLARAVNADPGKNKSSKRNHKAKNAVKRNHKAKNAVKRNQKAQKVNRKNKKSNNDRKKKSEKSRKNMRKNRKAKKVKKNNKRKSKSQQSKKQKKNKKTKNNKKATKSRKDLNKQSALRQVSDVPEQCLTEAVKTLYSGLSKKASFFERQRKRIEKYVPIISNKLLKAGDFKIASENMANITASCPNVILTLLAADISNNLGSCETNIKANCQPPVYNETQIEECKPVVEAFLKKAEVCYELNKDGSGTEACNCWQSQELMNLFADLSDCSIKESEKNVTERFKECKSAVSACNKNQTEAFPVFVSCATTGEALEDNTVEALEEKAELLANNIKALSQAATTVEEAATSAKRRNIRAAATGTPRMWYENCTVFIGNVEKLAELDPESTEIASIAEYMVGSQIAMPVTCTTEEKLQLKVQKAALDELIVEAEAALEVIQAKLEEITGTTLEIVTTPLPTGSATMTTAAARKRMREFLNQVKI